MVIDIEKVAVKNRIRKDFGDIQELADDIRQNGLINPPVVNKEYELLAGERRLRACKSLGWKQIEIRMMDTRDAEHELNVEISENDVRKGFTKSERVDYMKRLLRIEQAKAKERQGERTDIVETFPQSSNGKSRDKTAGQFGISGKTMEKEMSIVENKDLLSPEDFANWDEGKLSTNKTYQKVKAKQAELESTVQDLREERDYLQSQLEDLEPVTVYPDDYEDLKAKARKLKALKTDLLAEQSKVDEKQKEILELRDRIAELESATKEGLDHENLSENIFYFCTMCNNFIGNVGGLVWLTDRIADMPAKEKEMFLKAATSFRDWSLAFTQNLERSMDE